MLFTPNNVSETIKDIRDPKVRGINARKAWSWLQAISNALLDIIAIALAWIIAQKLSTVDSYLVIESLQGELNILWLIVPINFCIMVASGIYEDKESSSYSNLLKAICLGQITVLLVIFLSGMELSISRWTFMLGWGLSVVLVCCEKILGDLATIKIKSRFDFWGRRILLLGTREDTIKAKQLIDLTKAYKIQTIVDLSICQNRQEWIKILNQTEGYQFDEIFLCSWEKVKNPISLSWELKSAGINWRVLAVNLKLPRQWSQMTMLGEMPTVRFGSSAIVGIDFWCKRIFDLSVSGLLLATLALPMLLIAVVVKLDSPGCIFYKQDRVGLRGQHFQVWKFRTMVENAHELQKTLEIKNEIKGGILFKIKDDPRITKIGKFLRRHSLDELPQLINVLRGEMSLVGPRPLPLRDVARLSSSQLLRHEVLPGITGLWQVSGRSSTDSEEVFNLDFVYIQNWSLILDLQILLRTVQTVLNSKGAY
ncbi:MAG: sugar transferase [Hyellaceae cyanobacterium CSU_1_1]|nr:sugar transferase [Pleurocapsa sp. CRU_1_2]NJR44892.1 sugar transferase [Hyellaceae cyanobacterium CSU_1_1]